MFKKNTTEISGRYVFFFLVQIRFQYMSAMNVDDNEGFIVQ